MTLKLYNILIDTKKIGTTELEKADAPMGVVFGNIQFEDISSGYEFFKAYCLNNEIEIIHDSPDDRLIATGNIPNLVVTTESGVEIKGQGTTVDGMDGDIFEIIILGIPYPFFEEAFPHHVKAYNSQFEND